MARRVCSLACVQLFIAKFLRLFPKLALIFLIVHVTVMLYSVLSPKRQTVKPGNDGPPGVIYVNYGLQNTATRHMVDVVNMSHIIPLAKNKTTNSVKHKFNKTEHEHVGKKLRRRKKPVNINH